MCLKLHSHGVGTGSQVCLISELVLQSLQHFTASFLPLPLVLGLTAFPTPACRVDNEAPRVKLSHSRKYFPALRKFFSAPHVFLFLFLVFFFYKDGLAPRAGEEVNGALSHIIPSLTILLCPSLPLPPSQGTISPKNPTSLVVHFINTFSCLRIALRREAGHSRPTMNRFLLPFQFFLLFFLCMRRLHWPPSLRNASHPEFPGTGVEDSPSPDPFHLLPGTHTYMHTCTYRHAHTHSSRPRP